MATIQIDAVSMYSTGAYPVTISGIDPTDLDCFKGGIVTPAQGLVSASWNLNGLMRGGSSGCNLDTEADQFADLARLAQKLGVPDA